MKNVAAVVISIVVVVAIFGAIELLIGRPSNVPEKLELAAKLEEIDASVPHGVSNQEELKRLKKFIGEKKSLALGALVLFNAGGNKVFRYNSREWVNRTMRDGSITVHFDFGFDGVLQSMTFRDSKSRSLVCGIRFDVDGEVEHIKDADTFVQFSSGRNLQAYSRDLGDGEKFVFELSDDGSVFRNRLIDSEKRIKR